MCFIHVCSKEYFREKPCIKLLGSALSLQAGGMAPKLSSKSDHLKVRGNGTCLLYSAAKIKINPSDFYETTSEFLAFQRTLWGKDV